MKSLKQNLTRILNEEAEQLNLRLESIEASSEALAKTDIKNAHYNVTLQSMWADHGEESTTTNYEGTLKKAIETAEKEFKEKNKRSDVQAHYQVKIILGRKGHIVPEEYWERFTYHKKRRNLKVVK